ncbi:MAG: carboxylesterase family protein [Acholeplasmataceae bacterium]|nr:carboxylesterase family protein [Acholeplasmataceae bacterium]
MIAGLTDKNIEMKKIVSEFIVWVVVFSLNAQQANDIAEIDAPVIQTSSGQVRGKLVGNVSVFKGIPYAAPPVGEYRWRPPQPVIPWEGIRDALAFGPDCAQGGWGTAPGTIREGSSEDCLYLNLWIPAGARPKNKLPVMVWIHGGAFVGGSGASAVTSGEAFAKQGVILMTFNYRLGRLGHFAFPALSAEHPDEPKGSYAFMDMIAALQWVQDNIAAFGGDPNNVTIFGQSAGGVAVHSLLTIPQAKGLFHKAISHSGGGRDGVLTGRPINRENADPFYPVSAETIGINFARRHGIDGTDANALAKLRALSVEEIVDGGQESDGEGGPRTYSGPILDGKLVVETAESAYKAGRQLNVPLIIGSCSAEIGGSFVNSAGTKEELFSLFGELEDDAKAAYDPEGNKEFDEVQTLFNTDWVWAEPARFAARVFAAGDTPAYIFHYGYVPANMREWMRYGAGHGAEIPYVFNNLNSRRGAAETTTIDEEVARILNTYWANFAKTGNPNGAGLPVWPNYGTAKEEILDIQLDGNIVGKPDTRKQRLDVIEKASSGSNRVRIQSRGGI